MSALASIQGVLALTGYAFCIASIMYFRRSARAAVVLVCIAAGLLRMGCSLDTCLHPWDERYHALVAKHSIEDPLVPRLYGDSALPFNETNWTQAGVWLHKPPMATWLMAGSLGLFGNEVWAARLPSVLLGCIGAYLCFALGRLVVSPRVGILASVLWALNGHLIELASGRTATDHVDALLVVLVLAGVLCAVMMARKSSFGWSVACGFITGLGFLTKAWPAMLVLALAAVLLYSCSTASVSKRMSLMAFAALTMLVIVLPWHVYLNDRFQDLVRIESNAQWAHFTQDVEDHARPWHYYLTQFPMIHGEAAPIALLVAAAVLWRKRFEYGMLLLVWVVVPFALFSMATSKMPAYTAMCAPAIFLLIALVADDWWSRYRSGTVGRWWALLGVVLLVGLPLRFSLDRVKPFEEPKATYVITDELRRLGPKDIVIGFPDPIALMFHTEVGAAYSELGEPERTIARGKGYRLFRFQNGILVQH